jgi:hypothetical protein
MATDMSSKRQHKQRRLVVLEMPPVDSPETAVKIAIAAEVKGKK